MRRGEGRYWIKERFLYVVHKKKNEVKPPTSSSVELPS